MNINLNQKRQQLLCDKPGPCAAVVFWDAHPCARQMELIRFLWTAIFTI